MMKSATIGSLVATCTLLACAQVQPKEELTFDGQTETGYSYMIHRNVEGTSPRIGDRIRYTRRIRLGQDSIISPTTEQAVLLPERVQLPKPAPADFELLLLLSPGDSASVYVFGKRLQAIPNSVRGPEDTIIYDIVLKDIVETREQRESVMDKGDEAEGRVTQAITGYKKGLFNNTLITLPSGLQILPIKEGSGVEPYEGQEVEVHYCGLLDDKTVFDNSFRRGEPITFELNQGHVIQGWDEGIRKLRPGGSAILIIPPSLGYGAAGKPPVIPANATLYFYVELVRAL